MKIEYPAQYLRKLVTAIPTDRRGWRRRMRPLSGRGRKILGQRAQCPEVPSDRLARPLSATARTAQSRRGWRDRFIRGASAGPRRHARRRYNAAPTARYKRRVDITYIYKARRVPKRTASAARERSYNSRKRAICRWTITFVVIVRFWRKKPNDILTIAFIGGNEYISMANSIICIRTRRSERRRVKGSLMSRDIVSRRNIIYPPDISKSHSPCRK